MKELLTTDCDTVVSPSSDQVSEHTDQEPELDIYEEPSPLEQGMHEIGIQCYFEPVTLRSVAVQTESCKQLMNDCHVKNNDNVPLLIQNEPFIPSYVDAVGWNVLKDHTYSLPASPNVVFPTYDGNRFNIPSPELQKLEVKLESDDENVDDNACDTDDDADDEDLDPHWELPRKGHHPNDDDEELSDDEYNRFSENSHN